MMKIASIQMKVEDEKKSERLARAEALLDRAKGSDLVILPEIWNTGYFSFDLYAQEAEPLNGETIQRMSAKAREHGYYLHAGSFVENKDGRLYNTSLLLDREGKRVGIYRKIHLYGYGSRESQILSRGSEVVVENTPLGKIGLATCYDLRFPELFRAMLDKGVELFLVTSGWPYPRLEHWIMLNRVRAIENSAFLISSNCVGINRGARFCGHSMIVDPWGVILSSGGDEECILRSEIDLAKVTAVRGEFPAVNDRILSG
ncbi:MAG TPA: carbon-nitrogen family hydrolase [Thermodesulfobacteriota bacterium]|nr:carbon-nitrogen family hydrolase [Thermodesulfobacteriota bacterium]